MPRYFFDVQSGSGLVCLDYEGLDCADDQAALDTARHGAGFTSHGDCARNPQLTRYRFAVADAEHRPLFEVPFTELEPDLPLAGKRPRGPDRAPRGGGRARPVVH